MILLKMEKKYNKGKILKDFSSLFYNQVKLRTKEH